MSKHRSAKVVGHIDLYVCRRLCEGARHSIPVRESRRIASKQLVQKSRLGNDDDDDEKGRPNMQMPKLCGFTSNVTAGDLRVAE